MVNRSDELATSGAIVLRTPKLQELASMAGLPNQNLDSVLDSWVAGESEQAPALINRQAHQFTLAEPHALERAFIEEGGRTRLHGRKRGKRSKIVRDKKLQGR